MPYSDVMPALVYPDTQEGRKIGAGIEAAEPELRGLIHYCHEFKPKTDGGYSGTQAEGKVQCANASYAGDFQHNHCFRCICGYIFMEMDRIDFEKQKAVYNLDGIRG